MELMELVTLDNGTPVVSSRDVAERFGKRHDHVMRDIDEIVAGLPKIGETTMFHKTTYTASNKQEYPMYLMTRDGFSLLAMGFTGPAALEWKLKFIEAFNAMEKKLKPSCIEDALIQSILEIKATRQLAEQAKKTAEHIKDVVALNPSGWREDARRLIVKVAQRMGGNEYIRDVNAEVFSLVDQRGGVNLSTRLENKRRRMAADGCSKSKRERLTKVDVIADDKKLIEIYLAVVKDMAVKYGA